MRLKSRLLTLFFALIFFASGEILVRLDERFTLFVPHENVRVEVRTRSSIELTAVKESRLELHPGQTRIMTLGDSYMYGAGVNANENLPSVLKTLANQDLPKHQPEALVLDLSRPANNMKDNYTSFEHYVERYSPNIVVLAYSLNDSQGWLGEGPPPDPAIKKDGRVKQKTSFWSVRGMSNLLFHSALLKFILHKTHLEMKQRGYVMPGSGFATTIDSYRQNKKPVQRAKSWLYKLADEASSKGIILVVYLTPEFNMLENQSLYMPVRERVGGWMNARDDIVFIDGIESFDQKRSEDFRISKYDGHPNAKGHETMAQHIFEQLRQKKLIQGRSRSSTK